MEDKGEAGEMLDKEDMTDMFSRAMLEKMQPEGRNSGIKFRDGVKCLSLQRFQGASTGVMSAPS